MSSQQGEQSENKQMGLHQTKMLTLHSKKKKKRKVKKKTKAINQMKRQSTEWEKTF